MGEEAPAGRENFVMKYLAYKSGNELKVLLHSQDREDGHLMLGFTPGKDLVAIPDVAAENPDTDAKRQAEMYFRGEHPHPKRIDDWVVGALKHQAYLKAQQSNPS